MKKPEERHWVRAIIDSSLVSAGKWWTALAVARPTSHSLQRWPRASIDKERFVNARAEDYWTLRERFEQGEYRHRPGWSQARCPARLDQVGHRTSRGRIGRSIEATQQAHPQRKRSAVAEDVPGPGEAELISAAAPLLAHGDRPRRGAGRAPPRRERDPHVPSRRGAPVHETLEEPADHWGTAGARSRSARRHLRPEGP